MKPVVQRTLTGVAILVFAASTTSADTGLTCQTTPRTSPARTVPRTPWGDPDLQGIWSGAGSMAVPLDRDIALGTRNLLTDEEYRLRRARLLETALRNDI